MSTLKDCVAVAKLLLNHTETDMDALMTLWANQAVGKLTCPEIRMYKYCEACPDYNGRIEKPKGFLRPLLIRVHHHHEPEIPDNDDTPGEPERHHHHHNHFMVYIDEPFFGNCGYNYNGDRGRIGKYQINGNYIQLFGDTKQIHKVDLCYQSLNVDESGSFIVEDLWEVAIQFYICYMYSMMPKTEVSIALRNEYRDNWILNAKKINSDAQLRLFQQQRPQILAIMNSLVQDKSIFGPR